MKIRNGFVSNSSSSSFIVMIKKNGEKINYGDAEEPEYNQTWGYFFECDDLNNLLKKSDDSAEDFGEFLYTIKEKGFLYEYSETCDGYGFGLDMKLFSKEEAHKKLTEIFGVDLGEINTMILGQANW